MKSSFYVKMIAIQWLVAIFFILIISFSIYGADKEPVIATQITGGDEAYKAKVILDTDGNEKLLVKSDTSISTELGILQEYDQDQTLTAVYTDIYSVLGAKTLSGFAVEFNDKDVWVRLEIDGNEIFSLYMKKLKDVLDWNNAALPPMYVSWNDNLKTFYFTPNFPLKSGTSIKIQARSDAGKKYEASIIQVSN